MDNYIVLLGVQYSVIIRRDNVLISYLAKAIADIGASGSVAHIVAISYRSADIGASLWQVRDKKPPCLCLSEVCHRRASPRHHVTSLTVEHAPHLRTTHVL